VTTGLLGSYVGLVLVSHSQQLAEGLRNMVRQLAPDVPVEAAGGLNSEAETLGTSAPRIRDAIASTDRGDGVLVLFDLGSAALSVRMAVEELEPEQRARVMVSGAPLVEGAIVAGVEASTGASLAKVARAAAGAAQFDKQVD
jgi:dihydroxyacetone kinase phosphotransfer subunit